MKNISIYFAYLVMSMLLLYSCGKCSNKRVGKPFCENGYEQWNDVEIIEKTEYYNFVNSPYIIRTQEEYDSLYPFSKPIEIDFGKYTLLGIGGGGQGQDLSSISWVCRSIDSDEVKMYVKYSMKNQCAGSHIYSIPFAYWAIVPKLSDNTKVYFQTIDVNPFD